MLLLSRALVAFCAAPRRVGTYLPRARLFACTSVDTSEQGAPNNMFIEAQSFFADRGINLHCGSVAEPGSRTTSRLAVRASSDGDAVIGMFRPGTHDVVPCKEEASCHVPHHPAINAAIDTLTATLDREPLAPYDESTGTGLLRYLQISVERASQRVQVTLVVNAETLDTVPEVEQFAAALWRTQQSEAIMQPRDDDDDDDGSTAAASLHSLWVNLNPSRTNNILSYADDAWWLLHARDDSDAAARGLSFAHELIGANHADEDATATTDEEGEEEFALLDAKQLLLDGGCLVEQLPSGAAFVLPPYVFRQANLGAFDQIVRHVRTACAPNARVVEWYAGVGVLGLSLAPEAAWVRCSDVHPPHAAFAASRLLLPAEHQAKVTYAVGAAGARVHDASGADTALVDPPRKGLDAALLDALCESPSGASAMGRDGQAATQTSPAAASSPEEQENPCAGLRTLIYVSCGFPALARDADALLANGWRARDRTATAHILFPGADHIETVVVFDRDLPSQPRMQQRGPAPSAEAKPVVEAKRNTKPRGTPQGEPRRARNPESPRAKRLAKNKRRAQRDNGG